MNQFKVRVYKRNEYNHTTLGFSLLTEYILVEADYYIINDNSVLDFHVYEEYPEHVQSLYGKLKTAASNKVRTFHGSQWLEVEKVVCQDQQNTSENGTEETVQ